MNIRLALALALALLVLSAPSLAHADGKRKHWYFRAGGAYVLPLSSSDELELANVDGPASLAVSNGPIAGSGASVESTALPAVTIGYVLPWLDGKLALAGRPTAFVCERGACKLPTSSPDELARQLHARR